MWKGNNELVCTLIKDLEKSIYRLIDQDEIMRILSSNKNFSLREGNKFFRSMLEKELENLDYNKLYKEIEGQIDRSNEEMSVYDLIGIINNTFKITDEGKNKSPEVEDEDRDEVESHEVGVEDGDGVESPGDEVESPGDGVEDEDEDGDGDGNQREGEIGT